MTVERPEQNPTPSGMSIALPAVVVVAILGGFFLAIAGHVLSSQDFTEFLAVWGLISLVGTVLSSLEWEASRATATSKEDPAVGGSTSRSPSLAFLRVSTGASGIATLAMITLCIWVLPTILHGSWIAAGLLLVGVAGIPFQSSTRGILAGQRRVGRFSAILIGEVLTRLLLTPALLFLHASVIGWIGALAAGSWAWLLVAPFLLFRETSEVNGPTARQVASKFGLLIVGSVSYAAMLMAYPTVLAAVDGDEHSAYVAALGSALVVSRLPALLVLPLLPLLIAFLVRRGSHTGTRKTGTLMLSFGLVAVIALGIAFGPLVLRLGFGERYVLSGGTFGILLGSCLLLVLTSVLSSELVARGRHILSSVSWLVGAVTTGACLLVSEADVGVLYPAALLIGSALSALSMGVLVAIDQNRARPGTAGKW